MKNGEHFEKPNTEAKSKCEERGECFPYNVKQIIIQIINKYNVKQTISEAISSNIINN